MKKIIIAVVSVFVVLSVFVCFENSGRHTASAPVAGNTTVKTFSRLQFLKAMAESQKITFDDACKYDKSETEKFDAAFPKFSESSSNNTFGLDEYVSISRCVNFGYTYGRIPVKIKQVVLAKIRVRGSLKKIVYALKPFTRPCGKGYVFRLDFAYLDLSPERTKFVVTNMGHSEIAVKYLFEPVYYYRKSCPFPTWKCNLQNIFLFNEKEY